VTATHLSGMNEPLSVTISLPEAAKLLGISESLAREMSRAGEFPGAFRLRVRILVHRQVFLEELERLGRGQPLSERDTDRILARAMRDAHVRLTALHRNGA